MRKRIIAVLVALTLLFSFAPVSMAAEAQQPTMRERYTMDINNYGDDSEGETGHVTVNGYDGQNPIKWTIAEGDAAFIDEEEQKSCETYGASCNFYILSKKTPIKIECVVTQNGQEYRLCTTVSFEELTPFSSIKLGSTKLPKAEIDATYAQLCSGAKKLKLTIGLNEGWKISSILLQTDDKSKGEFVPKKKCKNGDTLNIGKNSAVVGVECYNKEKGAYKDCMLFISKYKTRTLTVGRITKKTYISVNADGQPEKIKCSPTVKTGDSKTKSAKGFEKGLKKYFGGCNVKRSKNVIKVKVPTDMTYKLKWKNAGKGCKIK